MFRVAIFLGAFVLLCGCYFDHPLTGTMQNIDPTLEGEWRDSAGEITVEVRPTADGYRLRYTDKDATYLFDDGAILEIDGRQFLQAFFYGEERLNGTVDDSPKDNPWMVVSIERNGDKIIVRAPSPDKEFLSWPRKNSAEFTSAFAAAIRRDEFLESPTVFHKIVP